MFIERLCDHCGEPFTQAEGSAGRPRRYCNNDCQSRASTAAYRERQKQRLKKAEAEAAAPAATARQVRDALAELDAATTEMRELRKTLRIPQRLEEGQDQTRTARDTLEALTERVERATRTLGRFTDGQGRP